MVRRLLTYFHPTVISFYPYFEKYSSLIFLTSLFSIFVTAFSATFPWLLRQGIDKLLVQDEFDYLFPFMILLAVILLLNSLFQFLQKYFSEKVRTDLSIHLRIQLMESIGRKTIPFLKGKHSAEFVSLFNNDIHLSENIPDFLLRVFIEFPLRIIALFITMLYLNTQLTLLVILIFPPAYFVLKKSRTIRKKLTRQKMGILSRIFIDFQEVLSGIKVVKVWNLLQYNRNKIRSDYGRYREIVLREVVYDSVLRTVIGLLFILLINLVIFMAVKDIQTHENSPGDYAGFTLAFWLFLQPIKQMMMGYSNYISALAATERVLNVLENDENDEINLTSGASLDAIQTIRIDHATLAHKEKTILENIDLSFKTSMIYAITGPNGAGKSTLTDSLVGMIRPLSGRILINDRPYETYNINAVRSRIAMVFQDVILFHDSIRENICFDIQTKDPQAQERYNRALKMADVNGFLYQQERSSSSIIGEGAANFSGGEKQRLCIARALYKPFDVLILDEPNSNISKDVFTRIMKSISEIKESKIIILITHDPAYLDFCDIIYEIHEKRVVRQMTKA